MNPQYCSSCGAKLGPNAQFCRACGHKVSEQSAPTITPVSNNQAVSPHSLPQSTVAQVIRHSPVKRTKKRHPMRWISIGIVLIVVFLYWLGSSDDVTAVDFKTTLKPSTDPIAVKYKDTNITVPGGLLTENVTLTVTELHDLPQAMPGLEPLGPAIEVTLGELHTFSEPIVVTFPFDPKRIAGQNPEDAFIAAYYDPDANHWLDVPFTVDQDAGVVKLYMSHLTSIQCYYSYWELGQVYDDGNVMIVYDLSPEAMKKFTLYETIVGRGTNDVLKPVMVLDVAKNAQYILNTLASENLKVPTKPKIYLTPSTNIYNMLSKNISIGMDIVDKTYAKGQPGPEEILIRNLTHELFHSAQRHTIGGLDYLASGNKNVSFWLEATAEYMANEGIWLLWDKQPIMAYEGFSTQFFEKSLYTMSSKKEKSGHEYDAGNFISYIQKLNPATTYELVSIGESYSSFPGIFASIYTLDADGYRTLDNYYLRFLEFALFDPSSKLNAKNNTELMIWVGAKSDLTFKIDELGNGLLPAIDGSGALTFNDTYSSGFYKFTTNCNTTLTITPQSSLQLSRISLTKTGRGVEETLIAPAGVPTSVAFGKNDNILLAQMSPTPGSLAFTYHAEPGTPASFTGFWQPASWRFVTVDATDSFWRKLTESTGKSKEQFLAEAEQQTANQTLPFHFQIIGADPAKPDALFLISNSNPDDRFLFDVLETAGNTLHVSSSDTNNAVTTSVLFDLTYQDNQIKGTMRSDISGSVTTSAGEEKASAYLVFDIVLVPKLP